MGLATWVTDLRSECIRFGEAVIADVIVSEVVFPLFVKHEVEKELNLTRLIRYLYLTICSSEVLEPPYLI